MASVSTSLALVTLASLATIARSVSALMIALTMAIATMPLASVSPDSWERIVRSRPAPMIVPIAVCVSTGPVSATLVTPASTALCQSALRGATVTATVPAVCATVELGGPVMRVRSPRAPRTATITVSVLMVSAIAVLDSLVRIAPSALAPLSATTMVCAQTTLATASRASLASTARSSRALLSALATATATMVLASASPASLVCSARSPPAPHPARVTVSVPLSARS